MNSTKSIVKRIAIIGPESTGKSQLAEQLADYYDSLWIPEFARTYLSGLYRAYTEQDVIEIYKNQFQQESDAIQIAGKYLFTDTEFIIAKVWTEHVFKTSPKYFELMISKYPYDFYLLTYPDLPWQYDPLRENPGRGDFFFNWYLKILKERNLNFSIVKGIDEARTKCAIDLIDKYFGK